MSMPQAWADLLEGLALLAQHPSSSVSPLHCDGQVLTVLADPSMFTAAELDRLATLGFHSGEHERTFESTRFGSA